MARQIGKAIDDHANRADTAWGMIVKADHTTTKIAQEVVDNDIKLKEGLKSLEGIVAEHQTLIPTLRGYVQEVVKQIALVLEGLSQPASFSQAGDVAAAQVDARLSLLQERVNKALRR